MKVQKFNQYNVINESVSIDVLQRFCTSLMNNQFLKSSSGEILKVTGIQHEDGSGKKFIVSFNVYDENQTPTGTKKKFFEVK